MFARMLVANRGEIAIRIMRASREMGIQTVAVYSEADRDALHLQYADEAVLLGAAAPRDSYLNIEKIIAAARQSGADAVHPGYGFLSENPTFADAVTAAGLAFIGPPAGAIQAMGNKAESKIRMKRAGVPTVPGREGLNSDEDFRKAAGEIGYPVLIKAAAGGGGRGMRVVQTSGELNEAIEGARREALNAFGDSQLLVEKYIPNAHHVEFQVLGDRHGRLVHLFERECSTQRRHQKIIEETPSPLLTPTLRKQMGAAAIAAAAAVGYTNAGTVEFIIDPDTLEFYFLEMNTRLQVEHPVTEFVTGLDLVHWQIRVAAGEPLPFEQDDLIQRGHAIECRIYAEDPENGFLPSAGRLLQYIEPKGPGLRVDAGYAAGNEVTTHYDPLLAKLIAYGEDRPSAIGRMRIALRDYVIHGVVTNVDFLQDVLAHRDFQDGRVSTDWVETSFKPERPEGAPLEALLAASLNDLLTGAGTQALGSTEADPFSPWKSPDGFRLGG